MNICASKLHLSSPIHYMISRKPDSEVPRAASEQGVRFGVAVSIGADFF